MATYALPSVEETQAIRRQCREWLHTIPTWQLEIWQASPKGYERDEMIADELKARKAQCTG